MDKKKKGIGLVVLGSVGLITSVWLFNKNSTEKKKKELIDWMNSTTDPQADKAYFISQVGAMTSSEVGEVYDFVFNYLNKNLLVPAGSQLQMDLKTISAKYNIFT